MTVRFGREICRRFGNYRYDRARQLLDGLRFKTYEKTYDPRDYRKDKPLGLDTQAKKWLKTKKGLSKRYYANLERWMGQAIGEWGADTSVKDIKYGDIEDLILGVTVSGKTKADMVNCYSQFFKWIQKREGIPAPEMPDVKYKLGWRTIIDMETQGRIIDEVKRICPNKRIWIGIKWLATYVAIRPQEIWQLRERDIDVDGFIVLPPAITKEEEPKFVPMLEDDIAIYNELPTGFPDLPFFRRHKGKGVTHPGEQISSRAFYRWWKKACANLGIEGVDLYGGTRHSSTSAMGEYFTADQIKKDATQHRTNKAFERYFRSNAAPKRAIYEQITKARKRKC
jgi:integrase